MDRALARFRGGVCLWTVRSEHEKSQKLFGARRGSGGAACRLRGKDGADRGLDRGALVAWRQFRGQRAVGLAGFLFAVWAERTNQQDGSQRSAGARSVPNA